MSSEQKIVKCNKCQKEGLHWGTKQVKDKTYNILLEQDGSEHRPYVDGKAECKSGAPKTTPDKGQEKLELPTSNPDFIQAMGKIIINLEERKKIEEESLTVLKLILSELQKK